MSSNIFNSINTVNTLIEEEHEVFNKIKQELDDFIFKGDHIFDIFKNYDFELKENFIEPLKGYMHFYDNKNDKLVNGYMIIIRNKKIALISYNNTLHTNGQIKEDYNCCWKESINDKDIILGYTYNYADIDEEDINKLKGKLLLFKNAYIFRDVIKSSSFNNKIQLLNLIKEKK